MFLVEQIITLCLSYHDQLRITAVDILFSMIASEYERQGGSFPTIESEVFAKLDKLVGFVCIWHVQEGLSDTSSPTAAKAPTLYLVPTSSLSFALCLKHPVAIPPSAPR